MSIWKYVGAAAGGVGGFFVGGPVGAAAGASVGYGVGSSVDASNASADAVDAANANAAGVTAPQLNTGAYGQQQGYWGGSAPLPASQQTIGAQANLATEKGAIQDASDTMARILQKAGVSSYDQLSENDRRYYDSAKGMYDKHLAQYNQAQQAVATSQQQDQGDPARFAKQGQSYLDAAHATIGQPGVNIDFSGAAPAQANVAAGREAENQFINGQDSAGLAQGKFIGAQDVAGQGQTDLAGRLQGDLQDNSHSLAQLQLAAATQQQINQQDSTVASATPTNYGLASRTAAMNQATIGAGAANASAQLRANEYQATVGKLGDVLANERATNLAAATQQRQTNEQALTQQRTQDLQDQGMSYQNAIQQAQQEAQQRQINAQREGTYVSAANQMIGAYQGQQQYNQNAQMRQTEQAAANNLAAQQIKAGLQTTAINAEQQDASSQRQMGAAAIGGGASIIGAGMANGSFGSGDPRAATTVNQTPAQKAGLATDNPYKV